MQDYNAKDIEKKWQDFWEENNLYKFDKKSNKPIFSIDVPPPYASAGHLHIGHALHYTQFEIIARYKRMQGYNVYFAPCFDNNGLPTEKYVEETLKISKKNVTKAEFRKLCLEESKKVEKSYSDRVFKALGHSYDWSLLYATIDTESQKVAQTSFIDLYEKKLVYRAEEPTLWCTYHQTALAQAEIEDLERETTLNYINFDLEDNKKITIATTRPEFLSSCVAIFVNPNDNRYKNLVNKKAIVPLFKQEVPILTDDKVDPNFGSGIVMVCTFGDTTDILWWKKHKLPLKISITKDGKLNENASKYKGLAINEAKKEIINDLEKENRIIKKETIKQSIGTCWRCSTPIEFIVTKQWFIKTLDHKNELIKQGKKIKWIPEFYRIRYEDWVKNLSWDWCISRQRYYGVPIPVWYCKNCGNVMIPDKKDLPIDPETNKSKKKCKCGSNEFIPEPDIFDTWMTSSMTPQIAGRWLENPNLYKKLYPFSIRTQSHDIIRTWAFYTILKSLYHFKSIPWKEIAIGTYVLDPSGKGMHKSKGNAVWTHEVLEKYNVDVLRYWVGTATFGEDLPFQEKELVAGNKFLTKLLNASKFTIMQLNDYKKRKINLSLIDKWMLSKLNNLIIKSIKYYDSYKLSEAKKEIEKIFWHTFCDNYLEIVKYRLYNKNIDKKSKLAAQFTLYESLLTFLKLISPIMPHITEEIYQNYFIKYEKNKSIHTSKFPKSNKKLIDKKIESIGDLAINVISQVRQFKTKNQKSLKTEITLTLDKKYKSKLKDVLQDIKEVTNSRQIIFEDKFEVKF